MNEKPDPKNRGLGRGLDAIFGEDEPVEMEDVSRETLDEDQAEPEINLSANEIINDDLKRRVMPIEWLSPCAFQPRKHFDQGALEDLAKSIMMHGILQPIVVRPMADAENQYEIIAGERRWRAAQMMQMHEVPVSLQYLDDEAVMEITLIENIQREDLTAMEEAKGFQELMDKYNHTQEKLSVTVGKSRSYIANSLRLLQLPESVQSLVNEGKLSAGHARALVGKDNAETLAKQIVADNLSVREVESVVKDNGGTKKNASSKTPKTKDVNTAALEEEMSRILGMNVSINGSSKNGHGSVKIDYKSLDQLDDVLHRLSKV
jgi:ParB family chromosome partitioning protein